MFYRCPKCKNIWQYPIEKCPNCFLGLEKLLTKTAKVIGISKVNIPTPLHPKVPYFVLVLEDYNPPSTLPARGGAPEKGNKWVQKSIKEYKIGDIIEYESSQDKNAVAIWRIKYDILEAIEKVIELLGGPPPLFKEKSRLNQESQKWWGVNSQTKILILPTLIAPKHPYLAVNTNPKFLESLINYLSNVGADKKNIKVAAQSFDETPIEVSAQKSQLLDVCLQNQITPLDLAKGNFVKKTQDGFTFEISEEVFNSNLIINLPILKIDSKLGVRGASENILKFLKKGSYLSLQYLYSPSKSEGGKEDSSSLTEEEMMEKLQGVLPNYLTIADGQTIQKTVGFTAFLGVILASLNPLNLDRVFAEICMVAPHQGSGGGLPEYLKKIKIEDIPIVGRKVEELQYEVEKT